MRFHEYAVWIVIVSLIKQPERIQGYSFVPASSRHRSSVSSSSSSSGSSSSSSSAANSNTHDVYYNQRRWSVVTTNMSSSSADAVSVSSTKKESSSSTSPPTSTSTTTPVTPDMKSYATGYRTVFQELPCAALVPSYGQVPVDLVGTYFRCGPAMFSAGSLPPPKKSAVTPKSPPVPDGQDPKRMVRHPFEGDGAVLAVSFCRRDDDDDDATTTTLPPSATARYRFVRTAGFTSERKRGQKLYTGMDSTRAAGPDTGGGVGNDFPLPWYRHHLQPGLNKKRKNTSNTGVVYWAKKLLTTWEGGLPYKLDSLALSTEGRSQLGGVLNSDSALSNKGAYDSARERMLFYTNNRENAAASEIVIYEFNSKFRLVSDGEGGKVEIKLPGTALLSDMKVTANYCVFLQPPVATNGMQFLISKEPAKTLSVDNEGTSLLYLIARPGSSSESKKFSLPLDQLGLELDVQFINAYEQDDETVVLDLIRSDGRQKQPSSSSTTWPWVASLSQYANLSAKKSLWRYRINTSTNVVTKECLDDTTQSSFAVINPAYSARKHRFVYTNVGALGPEVAPPQGIAKYDCDDDNNNKNDVRIWMPKEYEFCGEPMYAPKNGGVSSDNNDNDNDEEDDGYVLSVLYNGQTQQSELIVLSAQDVAAGPITRLPLGMSIPHGHFGCFASSEEAGWAEEEIERRSRLADKMEAKGNMWNEVKSDFSGLGLRLDDFEEYFGDIL